MNAPAAPDPNPADQLISKLPSDGGLYGGGDHQAPPTPTTTTADGLPTTVLQYEKDINQQPKQLVYSVGGGEPKNVIYGDPKASMPQQQQQQQHFEPTLSQQDPSGADPKPQIDYVYNDGNKTVIYTDQKGLESLYANAAAGGDLGLMEGTQIVVHGNVQYTQQQQPDGTMVYVVASTGAGAGSVGGDMNPDDLGAAQQIQQR